LPIVSDVWYNFLRPARLPGTRVHTIPDPLATSIAAAYVTTSTCSSVTSAPSPPASPAAAARPRTVPSFPLIFPAREPAGSCPGVAQEKPNLIGVLEATVPSPHGCPQRQTYTRARGTKK